MGYFKHKHFATSVKQKILAAFFLAAIAILSALAITRFSFREMMTTVDQLSSPNEKLTRLNNVFEDITMLDQQQRAEAIKNPQKPYKYFLDQSGFLHEMIDSLLTMPWDSVQAYRLSDLNSILDQRNQTFVSYLKVKAELADNREFSRQLDTLAALLKENYTQTDSSIITTQKRTITTYFQNDTTNRIIRDDRKFLQKLFSKRKPKVAQTPSVKVQEELNVTIDTLAIAKQHIDTEVHEIEKLMRDLELDQLTQRKKLQRKELELIHANSLFVNQLLNTLHEVENEELRTMRANNMHAGQVVSKSIERMNILMLAFFLGAAVLVYFILADISKSNYYKTQLERAKNEAEELSKIKQRFLANMSHEIRTPLQSIIGFAEQLREDTKNKESIAAIHSSSEHLLHIVNEVLDYSRISSGNYSLAKEQFKLIELIKEVEAAMRIQAERKNLTFIVHAENASEAILQGDPFRLRQILYNLLGNAVKFTHKGFVKLIVHTIEENDTVKCTLEVVDSGIGIESEELAKIFNQFEQANRTIAKQYGGTGLGLTIVKSLVDAQGGTLQVSSKAGIGSTFKIELRFEKVKPTEHTIPITSAGMKDTFNGKLIVVDDDEMILKLCTLILKKNNIDHVIYNQAKQVSELLPDDTVTHILLDIRMPDINGVELCRTLRKKYSSSVKFIALTAHVLPDEQEDLLTAGFDIILAKPFHENGLLNAIGLSVNTEIFADNTPDFSAVRRMTMGDESLFQSVILQFTEETTEDIQLLRGHLSTNNKTAVREIIHKLAGRFGQMGVTKLASLFHNMEVTLAGGGSVQEVLTDLNDALKKADELLEKTRLVISQPIN
jgi:signal transduction histidine kinase/DNA-binding response OmpR family regulator